MLSSAVRNKVSIFGLGVRDITYFGLNSKKFVRDSQQQKFRRVALGLLRY